MLPIASRTFTLRGREHTHQYVNSPEVACIIPVDSRGRLLLIRQYRAPFDRVITEFPAGKLEPGESPEEGALRELEEETGYRAGRLRHLLSFYVTPGYSSEIIHLFLATELTPTQTNFDDGEEIATEAWEPPAVARAIEAGEIMDGKTILGFWALERRGAEGKP